MVPNVTRSGSGVMLAAGCRWYPQANWEGGTMLPINGAASVLELTPRQICRRVS